MTKTQLKILDIAPPFIHLYVRVCSFLADSNNNNENLSYAKNTLETILKQWGRAFAFMSHQRHRAVVNLVQPDIDHLLNDKGAFEKGKEDREFLFTELFVNKMYLSAKVDKTVHEAVATAAAAAKAALPKKFVGQSRDRFNQDSSYRGQSSGGASRPSGRGGRGRGRERGRGRPNRGVGAAWTAGTRRYRSFSLLPTADNISPTTKASPFAKPFRTSFVHSASSVSHVGGRVKFFANNWKIVTSDEWVLKTVSEGLLIDFISPTKQFSKPRPIPMDAAMAEVCDKELTDLLAKGAVFLVTDSSWGLVWAYFSVPKPRGRGFRPIINLKPLNQFIKYLHFKMESLDSVRFPFSREKSGLVC